MKIFYKILLIFVSIFIFLLLSLYVFIVLYQTNKYEVELEQKSKILAQNLGNETVDPVLLLPALEKMKPLFKRMKKSNPELVYIIILDKFGKVIRHSENRELEGKKLSNTLLNQEISNVEKIVVTKSISNVFEIICPIYYHKEKIQIVRLGVSKNKINQSIFEISIVFFIIFVKIAHTYFSPRYNLRFNCL